MQTTSSTSGPTKSGLPTQIKLSEIIKLILQFLEQQGLSRTFDCLQKQSKISLNIIDKHVVEDIINTSNWEHLFKQLNYLTLPEDLLFDIYQLVIDDIIDKDNIYVAKLLCDKLVSGFTAIQYKERKLRIQYICQNPTQKAMYHKPPSQHRRETIINRILKETHQQVEKSRLLTLITSALKYEASKGLITPNISYSLLEGKGQTIQSEIEQMITKADKILRFSEQSRISCIQYSNKGAYIAMGGIDGLIELYQPLTYTLETRTLKYQQQGFMLYHEDSIEHLQFNETDEMLASVDKKNVIKIWNMETGKLLRKLQYGSYIGCFAWGIDSSQLFIGYHNVQMFGVRSMGLLGEFVGGGGMGGQDYLLKLAIAKANNMQGGQLFTFSQSATIRRYNIKTQQQSNSLNLANQKSSSLQPSELLKYIIQHTRQSSVSIMIFHVCFKKMIITVNQKLQQINKYEIDGSGDLIQLCNVCFVRNYIYEIVSKDVQITKSGRATGKEKIHYVMQVRQAKTGRIVYSKQIQQQVWIMEVHPFRNLLAMYTADHMLTFLRP